MNFKVLLFCFLLFSNVAGASKDLVFSGPLATKYYSYLKFESQATIPYLQNTCTKGSMTSYEDCDFPDGQCRQSSFQEYPDHCTGQISRKRITLGQSLESRIDIELTNSTGIPREKLDYEVWLISRDQLHAALLQAGLSLSTLRIEQSDQTFLVLSSRRKLRLKQGTLATDLKSPFQPGDAIKLTAVLETGTPTYKTYSVLGLSTIFPSSIRKTYDFNASGMIEYFEQVFKKSQPILDLNIKLAVPENSFYCDVISAEGVQQVSIAYQFAPAQSRFIFSIENKMVMTSDTYGRGSHRTVHANPNLGIPILSTFKNLTGRPFQMQLKGGELMAKIKEVDYIARRTPEGHLMIKSSFGEYLSCGFTTAVKSTFPKWGPL